MSREGLGYRQLIDRAGYKYELFEPIRLRANRFLLLWTLIGIVMSLTPIHNLNGGRIHQLGMTETSGETRYVQQANADKGK